MNKEQKKKKRQEKKPRAQAITIDNEIILRKNVCVT